MKTVAPEKHSPNTRRVYESSQPSILAWCTESGVSPERATPSDFADYIRAQHALGVGRATIQVRTYAFADLCIARGNPDPPSASRSVRAALQDVRRAAPRPKATVRLSYMNWLKMLQWCGDDHHGVRIRAALVLLWTARLRSSELCGLTVADLKWSEGGKLASLRLKKGQVATIDESLQRVAGNAVLEMFKLLGTGVSGPVINAIRHGGNIRPEKLNPCTINRWVAEKAALAGLSPRHITPDSIRLGGVQHHRRK
jgi:integrase